MHNTIFSSAARKNLKKLNKDAIATIVLKIEDLSKNPYSPHLDVKKLIGGQDEYRLRVGDYRVLYSLENKKLYIYIINIAHRKNVYK
jgi:mRNA interferase RelE/StbE